MVPAFTCQSSRAPRPNQGEVPPFAPAKGSRAIQKAAEDGWARAVFGFLCLNTTPFLPTGCCAGRQRQSPIRRSINQSARALLNMCTVHHRASNGRDRCRRVRRPESFRHVLADDWLRADHRQHAADRATDGATVRVACPLAPLAPPLGNPLLGPPWKHPWTPFELLPRALATLSQSCPGGACPVWSSASRCLPQHVLAATPAASATPVSSLGRSRLRTTLVPPSYPPRRPGVAHAFAYPCCRALFTSAQKSKRHSTSWRTL